MAESSNSVIDLSRVSLVYDDGTRALDGIDLHVCRGERICVLGANGSGKSTLASVIAGLLAPDEGTVTLLGKHVYENGLADFDAYRLARRKLGLVFQNPEDQIVTSVVDQDVAFGPENLGLPSDEIGRRVYRELHRVAMLDYAKADPARLSGGQRQRVTIASALAMHPEVLVLDEPSSALDVRGRVSIMKVVEKLKATGVTVVHVTHFMEEALLADRVVVLDSGHVALEGTPKEVFSHVSQMRSLGLSEPFAGKLSARLSELGVNVDWTCDTNELGRELAVLLSGRSSARRTGGAAGTPDETNSTALNKPQAEAIVSVSDVTYSYGSQSRGRDRKKAQAALDDLSLEIARGSHVALIGQTGSGKSTLLRLIAALETPDAGKVRVDGIDTADKRQRRLLHGRVGYVMQRPERQLFAETVAQDVAFGPKNMGLSNDEVDQRVRDALEEVGLRDKDDASPFQLSGGQQRLCAIAGVLAMTPDVLVLDEPTSGLDPQGRKNLRAILERVNASGVTLVEVTHSMGDAARADRVAVINDGRVMLYGTPTQVFSKKNADVLSSIGLGVPLALDFARHLEADGAPYLGETLTTEQLARAIAAALGADSSAEEA
ncbi:MAG: ABC transporter ATP-binding protein [Tractidigestivibacter sp.]|uniref:ABC transporter ATP-binding protein n=1 Tax=Tractidigestivibacter sp. TaxID=2847320 RepID=UPI003D94EF29